MKPSRLLQRLEAGIANARTVHEADCLRAERAGYLARLGQFDEVRAELAALHKRYDHRPNAEISAWVNLVEGLVIYFADVGSPNGDKMQRSLALSTAAGLRPMQALGSAWLAQFSYVMVDMDSMSAHLRVSLSLAAPRQHSARSRGSLVAAQALHLSGRSDLAAPWYKAARHHASADGDDATTSALMHNMAWLRMMSLRQSALDALRDPAGGEHALMGAESTSQFDTLVGDTSWDALKPILRAQILSLREQFVDALALYEAHLAVTDSEGVARLQANLLADKSWCLANVGRYDSALECARSAIKCVDPRTHTDDRAAAYSRLAQVFKLLGHGVEELRARRLAEEAWQEHRRLQVRIVELLAGLEADAFD
jgi:tetratricopeptide (TPR) repeat protein